MSNFKSVEGNPLLSFSLYISLSVFWEGSNKEEEEIKKGLQN